MLELPTANELPRKLDEEEIATLTGEVKALAAERDAVILAHNYQLPELQDMADFVGDSLGLSRQAAATEAEVIEFCGVHFMAETASVLCPDKTVLIADLGAGCSLAESINADQLRAWKAEHPGAKVVMYVNTSAEVKAETDYCCTSSNAVAVVEHVWEEHGETPRSSSARTCGSGHSSSARPDFIRNPGSANGSTSGTASATSTPGSAPRTSPPCARNTRTPSS